MERVDKMSASALLLFENFGSKNNSHTLSFLFIFCVWILWKGDKHEKRK